MADKMSAVLVDMAEDPDRLARFEADPQRELNRAGLTDTEKAAVLTRDSRNVRKALAPRAMADITDVLEAPPGPPPPPAPPPAPKPPAPTRRRPPTKRKPAKRRPKKPSKPSKRRPARKKRPSRRRKGPARKKR